jgi:hypothetical protein
MYKALCVMCALALFGAAWANPALEEAGLEAEKAGNYGPRKAAPRGEQFLLIPESSNDVVGMYDAYDGSYMGDIIVEDTTQFDLKTPINAVQGPDGNIYLSDQVSDAVFVFDTTGTYLYTYADGSDGLNNIRGIDFRDGHLFVTSGDDYVAEFDGPHSFVGYHIQGGVEPFDPFDILFLDDGTCLCADIYGSVDNISYYDYDGNLLYELFPVSFPEQVQFDSEMPGEFLHNSFSADLIQDFDIAGTVYNSWTYDGGRGVFRLGNGNLLATRGNGVHEIDPATGDTIDNKNPGVSGRFIELYTAPTAVEENGSIETGSSLCVSPNPFRSGITVSFGLERRGVVHAGVYSLTGARVATLATGNMNAGEHTLRWNGRDDAGTAVPEGVYFVHLQTSDRRLVEKVTLLR